MQLKRRVSLNSVQLDEIDNRILITGVDEAAGKETISAVSVNGRPGQRITNMHRDTLDVTVKFAMMIRNDDMAGRSELLEKVNAWANRVGYLRLNYRPGRRLQVLLAQAPGEGDLFNWSNEFTIVFRAYRVPYWEDEDLTTAVSGTAKSGSFPIDVPGNTETVAGFKVENMSGQPIATVNLKIGESEMTFTQDSMIPANSYLLIDHPGDSYGLFYIRARVGSSSKLRYRTGANDFYVSPGANTVTFSASRAVRVTADVRGRYL